MGCHDANGIKHGTYPIAKKKKKFCNTLFLIYNVQ